MPLTITANFPKKSLCFLWFNPIQLRKIRGTVSIIQKFLEHIQLQEAYQKHAVRIFSSFIQYQQTYLEIRKSIRPLPLPFILPVRFVNVCREKFCRQRGLFFRKRDRCARKLENTIFERADHNIAVSPMEFYNWANDRHEEKPKIENEGPETRTRTYGLEFDSDFLEHNFNPRKM